MDSGDGLRGKEKTEKATKTSHPLAANRDKRRIALFSNGGRGIEFTSRQ